LRSRAFRGSTPPSRMARAVVPSTLPPAASVGPSLPSASAANAARPSTPSSARASASENSPFGPPLPSPRAVTVASPPPIRAHGGGTGCPRSRTSRTIAAWTPAPKPASLALPNRSRNGVVAQS
jgi:hypothetical protein